jgi:hypothetical protein
MATFLQNNQKDTAVDKDKEQPSAFVTSSAAASTPGQSAGGMPAQGAQAKPQAPSSSGQFANLQNFIRANKSGQIGQQVGEKIGAEKQKAAGALTKAELATSKAVGEAQGEISGLVGKIGQAKSTIEGDTPGTYAPSSENFDTAVEDLGKGINYQYAGPSELANKQQLFGQTQNLQQIGQATKSEAGRMGLLRQFFGRQNPAYTTGQSRLDNLLLGRQADTLTQSRRLGDQYEKQLTAVDRALSGDIALRKQEADRLKTQAKTATEELTTGLEKDIISDTSAQAQKSIADLEAQFNTNVLGQLSGVYSGIAPVSFNEAVQAGLVNLPSAYTQAATQTADARTLAQFDPSRMSQLAKLGQLTNKEIGYSGTVAPIAATSINTSAQAIGQELDAITQGEMSSGFIQQLYDTSPEFKALADDINRQIEDSGRKKFKKDTKFDSILSGLELGNIWDTSNAQQWRVKKIGEDRNNFWADGRGGIDDRTRALNPQVQQLREMTKQALLGRIKDRFRQRYT